MNKCKLHYFRSVGKFFVFFEHEIVKRRRIVALAYNLHIPETNLRISIQITDIGEVPFRYIENIKKHHTPSFSSLFYYTRFDFPGIIVLPYLSY